MKIIVLSDLHAFTSDSRRTPDGKKPLPPSYIDFSSPTRKPVEDPLVGLKEVFGGPALGDVDLLIVAGDLGDKADPIAIKNAWFELHSIASLKGCNVLATCGNHDIDTRHKTNSFDPKGFLRTLRPSFPIAHLGPNELPILEYWANNFTVIEGDKYRILNINSCAYHGYGTEHDKELEHGRISDITLEGIEATLTKAYQSNPSKHNICLVHHHIKPVSNDNFEDSSTIKGAEKLTDLLSQSTLGEWLIVHGHRHRSNLFCAGGNTAPIVLSCASFATTRNGDEHNPCPNQFYLLALDEPAPGTPSRVSGTIRSWNWTPTYGWVGNNNILGGLPATTGFGFRGRIPDLAGKMHTLAKKKSRLTRRLLDLNFPDLRRLIPNDLRSLIQTLEQMGVIVTLNGMEIEELVASND